MRTIRADALGWLEIVLETVSELAGALPDATTQKTQAHCHLLSLPNRINYPRPVVFSARKTKRLIEKGHCYLSRFV